MGEIGVIRVGQAWEIPPGQMKAVDAGSGSRVVIANVGGQYYAFSARCPHDGGPLDEGTLWGGEIECPWHHYLYDIRTGENTYPCRVYPADMPELKASLAPVRRFPVWLEGPDILVEVSQ